MVVRLHVTPLTTRYIGIGLPNDGSSIATVKQSQVQGAIAKSLGNWRGAASRVSRCIEGLSHILTIVGIASTVTERSWYKEN
jgi:hypothetical protein